MIFLSRRIDYALRPNMRDNLLALFLCELAAIF